jgi:DNA-binding GntR family transcriptional regulator
MPAKRTNPARAAVRPKGDLRSTIAVADIVAWLYERIRSGRLAPGQRLVEADIIREFGGSRSRVREALRRLAIEGVVTIEEFKGASVKHLTRDQVVQLYRARMALEGMAARECASSAPKQAKQRLAQLQKDMNALEHSGDHQRFARLNDEWHRVILEGSGNGYIKEFVERLRVPVYRLLFSTFYNARRIDNANAGHRKITAAIVGGRAREAEKLMRDHIAEGLEAISTLDPEFFN